MLIALFVVAWVIFIVVFVITWAEIHPVDQWLTDTDEDLASEYTSAR